MEQLGGIPLLKDLPADELASLARQCAWVTYDDHELVVDYADTTTDVRFIQAGAVRVIFPVHLPVRSPVCAWAGTIVSKRTTIAARVFMVPHYDGCHELVPFGLEPLQRSLHNRGVTALRSQGNEFILGNSRHSSQDHRGPDRVSFALPTRHLNQRR